MTDPDNVAAKTASRRIQDEDGGPPSIGPWSHDTGEVHSAVQPIREPVLTLLRHFLRGRSDADPSAPRPLCHCLQLSFWFCGL